MEHERKKTPTKSRRQTCHLGESANKILLSQFKVRNYHVTLLIFSFFSTYFSPTVTHDKNR